MPKVRASYIFGAVLQNIESTLIFLFYAQKIRANYTIGQFDNHQQHFNLFVML